MTLLKCEQVSKKLGGRNVLSNINLSIESGHIVGLLGPNGCGKTTLIKMITGLLSVNSGEISIYDEPIGINSKRVISYLPDHTYLNDWMKVREIIGFFKDFYEDFDADKAYDMLSKLKIQPDDKLKTMSKGTKEKVQLILVMSRKAKLYILDEPIASVDPAARDFILKTIINNYNTDASVLISTHLISDIENILDEIVFLNGGKIILNQSVEQIREEKNMSVDALFREVFQC